MFSEIGVMSVAVVSADTNIVASVIGALIGALFGALSAFLLSEYSRKKQIELEKVQKNNDKVTVETSMLMYIQKYVVNVITQSLMNTEFAKDLQSGIFSKNGSYNFSLNIPATYPEPTEVSDFINNQLFFQWEGLNREVYAQNQVIVSIAGYYDWLRRAMREHIFADGSSQLNRNAMIADDEFIKASMGKLLEANEAMYERCIAVMAHIRCYVNYINSCGIRESSALQEVRSIVDQLRMYEPGKAELKKAITQLTEIYNSDTMYKTTASS